jgi:hypothetical protein
MGCPTAITGYLASLQEIKEIHFNIETRQFTLTSETYNKTKLKKALKIVSKLEKRIFILSDYSEKNL